ncbi:hypothetical protein K3N28_08565 [Glycomyces sp. TRM65418]|uniref:hypothetical protein n=1 Tax=Glycomyces sp. TRM65418 TaxID=2867006 RepID=UPI001CE6B4BC|nr:hypothetical protein [Glycomyces sp. TRM65418]MCC3763122.1 hypothetical protein [Glycomyces sp. TRM65418]QZD57130.1 hypothetical protein K3N28_08505 [Glycomyces sp. TRM65418]
MTQFYQALLRDGGQRLGPRLRRCFAAWAGIEDDGAPHSEHSRGRTRIALADSEACGRYTHDVPTGGGRLRTTATWAAGRKGAPSWVRVTVEGDLDEAAVTAPGFMGPFLATGRATDGAVPVEAGPHLVGPEEVKELTRWLAHPDRAVPIIVLTVDRNESGLVTACADHLAEALAGVAVVARLYDARTQDDLNAWLGPDLSVFGGGLRTYLPGLRPGEESYAMRHQPRGGSAIRDQGVRALGVVVSGVVELSVHRPLPVDVRQSEPRVGRVLAGALAPADLHAPPPTPAAIAVPRAAKVPRPRETSAPTAPVETPARTAPVETPGPPVPTASPSETADPRSEGPEPAGPDGLADQIAAKLADHLEDGVLEALVDMARGGDSETTALIKTMSAHLDALTRAVESAGLLGASGPDQELERLRRQYDQLELDFVELQERDRKAQDRIRWLEGRLAEHADPVYGVQSDPDPEGPWEAESLMDVVQRARKRLRRLDLPDALDTEVSKLDVTYPRERRRWTGRAWDALRALDAYAAARAEARFTGGFYDWCSRPLPGAPIITPAMVSMKESDSVSDNPKFYRARIFRVPAEIDPSGSVYMPAHIKLQPVGSPAPRMHFLDDAGGTTGKIWIGYLGDHLPNTRTN